MNLKQKFVAGATAASMAVSLFVPFAGAFAAAPGSAFQKSQDLLNATANNAGIQQTTSLPELIGKLINVVLGLLGLILLGLCLYAGFKWMTAQGDTKAVDEAKDTLKNAVIGLIIVIASYSISTFVMEQLLTTVSKT